METKEATIIIKLTPKNKETIEKGAKNRELTMTALIEKALEYYLTFPIPFIDQIEAMAEKVKLPPALIISNLFQVYVSQDAAITKHFGSRTWERAFKMDPVKGLITDESISTQTFKEVDQAIEDLKAKFKSADKKKEKITYLTKDESALIAWKL